MKIVLLSFGLGLVAFLLAILYLSHRLKSAPDRMNLEAAIDAEVGKAMKKGLAPGIVVGVYKDGRTFIKGYGTVDKEVPSLPGASTTFQIGSLSKIFTASLLHALCDEGVVSMDATLGRLIGGSNPLSPAASQVTLKQLVTHTSGFPSIPRFLGDKMAETAGAQDPLRDPYSALEPKLVFEYLATTEDLRAPGRFEYSNFGMGLLAHVLEVVVGRDYESLVKEKVLAPLGMSGTAITLVPEIEGRLARGYTAEGRPTPLWRFGALAGAGAYASNAEDLMKFVRGSVEPEGPASRAFRKMREAQYDGESGIGWMQPTFFDRFFGNRNVVWHNGMVGGYASYLSIDDETRTGVVVLINQARATESLGMMLTLQARTQSWSLSTTSADRAPSRR